MDILLMPGRAFRPDTNETVSRTENLTIQLTGTPALSRRRKFLMGAGLPDLPIFFYQITSFPD
jgi:hypothetical protein